MGRGVVQGGSKGVSQVCSRDWTNGGFGKGGVGNLVVAKIALFVLLI